MRCFLASSNEKVNLAGTRLREGSSAGTEGGGSSTLISSGVVSAVSWVALAFLAGVFLALVVLALRFVPFVVVFLGATSDSAPEFTSLGGSWTIFALVEALVLRVVVERVIGIFIGRLGRRGDLALIDK